MSQLSGLFYAAGRAGRKTSPREEASIYIFVSPSHIQRTVALQLQTEQCQYSQQGRDTLTSLTEDKQSLTPTLPV